MIEQTSERRPDVVVGYDGRTTSFGGLELGTGLAVTDVRPEVAASALRAALADAPSP